MEVMTFLTSTPVLTCVNYTIFQMRAIEKLYTAQGWHVMLNCASPKSYAEARNLSTSDGALFEKRAFKRMIELQRVGPSPLWLVCPHTKKKCGHTRRHQERTGRHKVTWGHSEKTDIYKLRRQASAETNAPSTSILEFQPPEPWDKWMSVFKPPSLQYFVMAAQADEYNLLQISILHGFFSLFCGTASESV